MVHFYSGLSSRLTPRNAGWVGTIHAFLSYYLLQLKAKLDRSWLETITIAFRMECEYISPKRCRLNNVNFRPIKLPRNVIKNKMVPGEILRPSDTQEKSARPKIWKGGRAHFQTLIHSHYLSFVHELWWKLSQKSCRDNCGFGSTANVIWSQKLRRRAQTRTFLPLPCNTPLAIITSYVCRFFIADFQA